MEDLLEIMVVLMSEKDYLFLGLLLAVYIVCEMRISSLKDKVKLLEMTVKSLSIWVGNVSKKVDNSKEENR